jgi:trk system potassium uptake protein TrkH
MFTNLKTVLKAIGSILVMLGALMFSLLLVACVFWELKVIKTMIFAAVVALSLGLVLKWSFKDTKEPVFKHALVCVALVWLIVPALSALPFIMIEGMSPLDAFFEAMSGWTGTGLTMVAHPSNLSHTMQFWRSLMQWVGGVGVIVLMLAILARPGTGAFALYKAEAREERIKPSIVSTVRMTWWIYLGLTFFGIFLLFFAGMKPWEAINHAMTAIGTGGFSITDNSLTEYNNVLVECATMPIMILGAIPFLVHYKVLKGYVRVFFKDMQCRAFFIILLLLLIPLFVVNHVTTYGNIFDSLLLSSFQLISGLTCTGFQTTDLHLWSGTALSIVCVAMVIGGGAGSTAGGIKLIRAVIVWKGINWSLTKSLLPKRAFKAVKFGDTFLNEEQMNRILSEANLIIVLWILFLILGIGVLSLVVAPGSRLCEVIFEVASAQSNVGLSTGITNVGMPDSGKIMLILNMWIGRLEIMPVLMFFRSLIKGFDPL